MREWQKEALSCWEAAGNRGIVAVVTGGGKTVFALTCISRLMPDTSIIIVPTLALLDQWWEETCSFFDLALDDVNVITNKGRVQNGTINIVVLNTASKLHASELRPSFLVVDECHKAASAQFRVALEIPKLATLGLSATPERPYDEGLKDVLVPALGPVIFEYTYKDALRDGVIVPFMLRNVVFDLEEERQQEYDKLTKAIARSMAAFGSEAEVTIRLLLRRSRVLNLSLNRVRIALRLVAQHQGRRVLVFHEDIEACNLIHSVLTTNGVRAGVYHSKLKLRERAEILAGYRHGQLDVLVTCRALDEGFNVPETEVGIVAASTATRRQRIQRMGRILRPATGKTRAILYTLVATAPEVMRLKEEENNLEGVAEVSWSHA